MISVLLHTLALAGVSAPAVTTDTRALIEQALDEPTTITLTNVKLSAVLERIAEQTGVQIVIPPDVTALIPHGMDTLVGEVEITNAPLRDGLTRLFSPLGMMFAVRNDHVEIVPKEALLCLGRPPTWVELDTLAELAAMQPGVDEEALHSLRSRIQFHVPQRGSWLLLSEAIHDVGAGSGDEALTVACANLGWAWCLSGRRIAVTSMQQQIQRQLRQPISVRVNNRSLFDVMRAVGERVNVEVRCEPGALASLPIQMQRNFSINAHRQTAEEVFETIAAYTGLGYLIEPEGVLFYQPVSRGGRGLGDDTAPASVSLSDPYVGKMVVPLKDGKSIEWLIRWSELPEDLRQMRERDIAEIIEALREKMATTRP